MCFGLGDAPRKGTKCIFQAHTSPGVYARAYLEGRLTEVQLRNFRRELSAKAAVCPPTPHPRRLPWFWTMPTASMGLSTPCAIYQARFAKYLESRGLKRAWRGQDMGPSSVTARRTNQRFWHHQHRQPGGVGQLGWWWSTVTLQRLDGPVRGNGKIIQELERAFRGADWHVIKVIWGSALGCHSCP